MVRIFLQHKMCCIENLAANYAIAALVEDASTMKTTNRRLQFFISILVSMAVLASFAQEYDAAERVDETIPIRLGSCFTHTSRLVADATPFLAHNNLT